MAAYSKAQKRRLKKGRPLLPVAEREPNGRKSRRKSAVMRRTHETEAETKMVVIAARMKAGMSRSIAECPEAGSVLGRLHILFPDRVSYAHYQAGLRYGADYCRYYALSGIPYPSARAHDMTRVHGLGIDKPEAAAQSRERIHELGEVIRKADQSGRPVASVMRRVCILDEDTGMHLPHMIRFLSSGLDALVDFYGIDRRAIPEDLTNE
ncbi:MAG: hypothetical protein NBV76_05320 [Candidatus Ochrobactrum gambitense]|nr:MAG: hypothetical protein NBV76_05320 [Candidatus Ochrobactrum gambitense]WEK17208.1 MAG: hypothetical protein P0Y54_05640 [Candidatus Ochrobactrum gambitense]